MTSNFRTIGIFRRVRAAGVSHSMHSTLIIDCPVPVPRKAEELADRLESRFPALPDGYRVHAQVLMDQHAIALLRLGREQPGETRDVLADTSEAPPDQRPRIQKLLQETKKGAA